MNRPARRRVPDRRGSITDDAPLCEEARLFEMNTDVIGKPQAPNERRGLADGAVQRFEGCRRKQSAGPCPAPPFEKANPHETGADLMQTTRMRGAARCSCSSLLRVIRSSSSPVRPTLANEPRAFKIVWRVGSIRLLARVVRMRHGA